jgi:hypothetical protein
MRLALWHPQVLRLCCVLLASLCWVGASIGDENLGFKCKDQPYVLITGVRTSKAGRFYFQLKWEDGGKYKVSIPTSVEVPKKCTGEDLARAVAEALNDDDVANKDWTFKAVQGRDQYNWVCLGTKKRDSVVPCGWDNHVGDPSSPGEEVFVGLTTRSDIDPVIGDVTFDIFGIPSSGTVTLAADSVQVSAETAGLTISEIEDYLLEEFELAGVPAELVDGEIVIRDTDLDARTGGGASFGTTDSTVGGKTAVLTSEAGEERDLIMLQATPFYGGSPSDLFGGAQAGTTWIGWTSSGSGPWKVGSPGVWDFDDGGTDACPFEDGYSEYLKNGAYAQGWYGGGATCAVCEKNRDFTAVRDRSAFINNDPCGFENSLMSNCVLTFYDPNIMGQYLNGGHYDGSLFLRIWSPVIDLTSYPDRGYLLEYDSYEDLPVSNWIFSRYYCRYVQDPDCPTGSWSRALTDNYVYYQPTPTCARFQWEFSHLVPADADSVAIGLAVWSGCKAWNVPCTQGNESPCFDNIRLGIFDLSAPMASIRDVDNYTDAFPEHDGLLEDATDVALIDAANNKSQQGYFLRLADSAVVQLDAPDVQAELCFRIIPGAYTDLTDAFFTDDYQDTGGWAACQMSDDVFCTRMDTAFAAGDGDTASSYEFQVTFDGYFASMIHEADPNYPGYEGKEIFPDSLFTPGTQIYYAFRTKFVGGLDESWLPSGADLVNDPEGTAFEVSVLPDLCKEPVACLLYVDYFNRGAQVPIENALTMLGRSWDRFDLRAESSHQANGIGNRKLGPGRYWQMNPPHTSQSRGPIGPSLAHLAQYKAMMVNSGNFEAGTCFSDGGTGTPDDPSNDVGFMDDWISEGPYKGLWLSGNNIATDFATATSGPKPGFLTNEMGTTLIHSNYQEWSGHPIADNCRVLKSRDGEMKITNAYSIWDSLRVFGSGCPDGYTYDVLLDNDGATGYANVALMYDLSDGYASVDHIWKATNAPYDTVRTKIDGFSMHNLRNLTPPCDNTDNIGIALWIRDVLGGAGNKGYFYDTAGQFQYCPPTGTEDPLIDVPRGGRTYANALFQNYPNPFRGGAVTTIHYSVAKAGPVEIRIFDVAGRLVSTIVDKAKLGDNFVRWDGVGSHGRSVPSGVYFYQIVADGFSAHKKMLMVK